VVDVGAVAAAEVAIVVAGEAAAVEELPEGAVEAVVA